MLSKIDNGFKKTLEDEEAKNDLLGKLRTRRTHEFFGFACFLFAYFISMFFQQDGFSLWGIMAALSYTRFAADDSIIKLLITINK